jgi:hypothetical protein
VNPALAEAHARLVPWFEALPRERHPWWWPQGAARSVEAWGVPLSSSAAESLGYGLPPSGASPLDPCLGSVGAAGDARYWLLLDAPPSRGGDASLRERLPLWLNRLGLSPHTHLTTVRKFRAPEVPEEAVLDAAACLAAEVAALRPGFVLAGPNARRTLRALHDLLRERECPSFQAIRSLLEVSGTEGRMPHQLEGAAQATAVEAWRLRLPSEDQNLPVVRVAL